MTLGPSGTKFFPAAAVPAPVATVAPEDAAAAECVWVMAVVTDVVQLAEALGLADASALDVVAFGPRV
jgi:hypothetical protein